MLRIGDNFYADGAFKKAIILHKDHYIIVQLYESAQGRQKPSEVIRINSENEEDAIDLIKDAIDDDGIANYNNSIYRIV